MAIPRVRRMVIFKHGVAYLERGGPATGPFDLSFKKDEMNDVLKSLSVWVARGDGTIGALAFEKPEDPTIALDERSLNLPLGSSMYALLGAFRGRKVAIESGGTRYEGEVIGIDRDSAGDKGDRTIVSLRTSEGNIALVDLSVAKSVELRDDAARADLAFLIDRTRAATAGTSRTVRVAVNGHAEDVRVSYVIPAPTWRVSYRVAREGSETTLMAWGIVHNPADEDLDDIELTLTTGQPISFVIDLYNPKNVSRVVVEEKSRAASAPTSFERAAMAPPAPMASRPRAAAAPKMAGGVVLPFLPDEREGAPATSFGGAQMMAQADGATEYADRGELFEYKVGARVSLKRGGSAMVPLLAAKLEAKRERIWREASGASPDLVLTFANTSGAVLEEGPAVIYDGSVYAGEAMVPYSARGVELKLAFAKDLGVRCKRHSEQRIIVSGVRLGTDALFEEYRREEHHEISVENDHGEAIDVIVELPRIANRSIDPESAQPFEETTSFRRFRVTVAARARASLKVVERWHDAHRFEYTGLTSANLKRWLADQFLDQALTSSLAAVVAEWRTALDADAQVASLLREREAAYQKQSKISEQLNVLKEGGAEGNLRLRYVRELEAEQDRINTHDAEIKRLEGVAVHARRQAQEKLAAIVAPKK